MHTFITLTALALLASFFTAVCLLLLTSSLPVIVIITGISSIILFMLGLINAFTHLIEYE